MKFLAPLFLLVHLCAVAQTPQTNLSSWMDTYVSGKRFRGNILAERDGRMLLEKSYGLAIEGWKVPNSPQTRFELASVSKQFTAAAILQLVEAGKVSLDDPIAKYYTEAPQAWKGVTIHELLTHTSGIPNNKLGDYSKGIATPYTPDELIQTFRNRPLDFAPGTKWAYTNTEYYLLAWLIEQVSGETYGDYLVHHIFEPLGMGHSGFFPTLAVVPEMAEGYSFEDGHLRHRDYFDRSLEIGAGGISTTMGDMVLWNKALDASGFLSAHSLELMFSIHPPGNYGYGWFVESSPRRRMYHEGSDPGFAAFEARYPDQHLLILVLSNEDDTPVRAAAEALAKRILDPEK